MYISEKYRTLNKKAHSIMPKYGAKGDRRKEEIKELTERFNVSSVIDYGCGKGALSKSLPGLDWREYDPAIPGKDTPPTMAADMVVCTDVLEHVEEEYLEEVLEHIMELIGRVGYLIISLIRGGRKLPDGSPAHRLIKSSHEWYELICEIAESKGLEVRVMRIDKRKMEMFVLIKSEGHE